MIDVPTRVKDALRENNLLKNYRFNVLNDDDTVDFTIDNNNLKSEKVCFDERLASGDVLKFGLCEGTSLEFQYFNLPDINGRRIQAFIDVQYKDAEGQKQWYTIPMGFYTVKKCPMQFSTGIRKVTAYNKLMSDYLDSDMTTEINELIATGTEGNSGSIPVTLVLNDLLNGYSIVTDYKGVSSSVTNYKRKDGGTINSKVVYYRDENGRIKTKYLHYFIFSIEIVVEDITEANICEITVKSRNIANAIYSKYHEIMDAQYYTDRELTTTVFDYMKNTERSSVGARIKRSNGTSTVQYITYNVLKDAYDDGLDEITKLMTNIMYYQETSLSTPYNFYISVPCLMVINGENQPSFSDAEIVAGQTEMIDIMSATDWGSVKVIQSPIGEQRLTTENMQQNQQVTIRDLQTAVYELNCQFGKLDRQTDLFSGVELNNLTLYPQDVLYPEDTLYPSGTKERTIKSSYSQLWTDDGGEQSFKYLIITYQGLDENNQKVEFTLQRTINTHGTTNYNLSDNWLFKNLVWTAEQVGAFADAMVEKMRNIRWFPFEMWASGLPYLETGDEIEIVDRQGQTHTSYVLKRTLEGIQNLQDTYENGIVDVF